MSHVAASAVDAQLDAALGALRRALDSTGIVGAYLYGSAVTSGLRPDSDLDLIVLTDRPMEAGEKERLVEGLLPVSGRQTRPSDWRPIEMTSVVQSDVQPWRYPPRMDFLYGEWLRSDFLAGRIAAPHVNPDLGVLISMILQQSQPLIGPPASEVLDAVPHEDLVRAMVDTIPSLVDDLADDTRNVLLTLARIWCTIGTREIRSKDAAADWALPRLPATHAPMLARARDLYRHGGYGDWPDAGAVRKLADLMVSRIRSAAVE